MTNRRWGRSFAIPYLMCLLCATAFTGKLRDLPSEALQTVSSRTQRDPLPFDEYQKLRAQALKKATVLQRPKSKNPAISSYGLTPGILRALQEQRAYLETQGTVTLAAINRVRESAGKKPRQPFLPLHLTCYKPINLPVNGKLKVVLFMPPAA